MIVLRNIVKENDIIEADYYPENGKTFGHIKVDLKTEEVISCIRAEGYEAGSGVAHALNALLKMSDLEEMPKEKTVMWY